MCFDFHLVNDIVFMMIGIMGLLEMGLVHFSW